MKLDGSSHSLSLSFTFPHSLGRMIAVFLLLAAKVSYTPRIGAKSLRAKSFSTCSTQRNRLDVSLLSG